MSVGEDEIGIAVVVVVEELQPPAAQEARSLADLAGLVQEGEVFLVLVEAEEFLIDVGDEQVLPAVAVVVGGVNAHPRARRARVAEGHARGQADLLEPAAATVHEEEVGHRVVGDEEIEQPVVVHVGRDRGERLAERLRDAGLLAHVRERPVAVVVEEVAGPRLEDARDAVVASAHAVVAAEDRAVATVLDEAGDEEIELAVAVVVEPRRVR